MFGIAGHARWLMVWVGLAWGSASAAAGEPLTIRDAYAQVGVTQAAISPDGRHVAAIVFTSYGNRVLLVNTDDFSSRAILHSKTVRDGFYEVPKDPFRVTWVTSDRLAVDFGTMAEAVDLDGKRVADLGTRVIDKLNPAAAGSPLMLVYDDDELEDLAVVDVATRKRQKIRYPMSGRLVRWAFDDQARLRAVTLMNSAFWDDKTTLSHWFRPLGSDEWQKIEDAKVTDETWRLLGASSTSDDLVVASRQGRDTYAVFSYDPRQRQLRELLAGHPKEDIVALDDVNASTYRSVATSGMKPVRQWFDSRWAGLQQAADEALPNRLNRLSGDPRGLVLVESRGDVDPGRWFLLDTKAMTMRLMLTARAEIVPEKMRPMDILTYPSKDGMAIPAYLTLPEGAGPHPMVVLVHGGPAVRDHWGWDAEVQLLATRGYAVFQPQFRGSAGFGRAFEQAGYGQWGLAMQDDITAGVELLIQRGMADPKRICIYGASYGGYAAVWGLIKTPELYRCGVTLAGVADIEYMLTDWSDRNSNKVARELMRFQIGDRDVDKAKFDQVSPLRHAGRIQAPLLIAHGAEDRRVPISHARKLMKALDEHRKTYQWLRLEDEGHGFMYLRTQFSFSEALLGFFDRHIGPGAVAPASAPPGTADPPGR